MQPGFRAKLLQHSVALTTSIIGAIAVIVAALITARAMLRQHSADDEAARLRDELRRRDSEVAVLRTQLASLTGQRERQPPRSPLDPNQNQRPAPAPAPISVQPELQHESSTSEPREASPVGNASASVFASGVEFEKPSCTQRAGTVRCEFRVTNREAKSQELEIEITNISGSSWYTYIVDANGLKYYANDAQIAGVQMHIWQKEQLDPEVPIVATVIYPAPRPVKPPLATSVSVRIKPSDSPQIGAPQSVFFKDIQL